jgi:hypothetical protein
MKDFDLEISYHLLILQILIQTMVQIGATQIDDRGVCPRGGRVAFRSTFPKPDTIVS